MISEKEWKKEQKYTFNGENINACKINRKSIIEIILLVEELAREHNCQLCSLVICIMHKMQICPCQYEKVTKKEDWQLEQDLVGLHGLGWWDGANILRWGLNGFGL